MRGGDVDPHQRPAPRARRGARRRRKSTRTRRRGGVRLFPRGSSETAERIARGVSGTPVLRVADRGPATRPSDAASTWRASAANAKGGESGGEESRDARLGAAPPRALDQDEVGTPKKPEAGGPAIAEPNAGAEVEAEANANADSSASDGPSSPFKSRSSPVAVPTTSRASSAARSRLTWPGAPRHASRGRAPTPDPEMMLDLSRAVAAARWAGGVGAGAGARPDPRPRRARGGSLEDLRELARAAAARRGGRGPARGPPSRAGRAVDVLRVSGWRRRSGRERRAERGWPSAAGGARARPGREGRGAPEGRGGAHARAHVAGGGALAVAGGVRDREGRE